MGSWGKWSSWHHKSYNNDKSATHDWNDWDWKSSRSSPEHHSTDWVGWNDNEEWEGWTSNDSWKKDQGQQDWNWNEQTWKWPDDWEEVAVEESQLPKATAAKTKAKPKPTAKAKPLLPHPPKTVPPPHVSLGVLKPPPAEQKSPPTKSLVKPPVKPVRLLVVPMENAEAPLALRRSTDDPPTSMSPKRKSEPASPDNFAKEQKIGHHALREQKEGASGSGPPGVPSYSASALAAQSASPKSMGGWKAPTAPEESPRDNAEVLAAHAAALALAAGGVFIPGRFFNAQP